MNSICWEITQYNNIPQKEKMNVNIRAAMPILNEMTNSYVNFLKFFKYDIKFNESTDIGILIDWCEGNCKGPWKLKDKNTMVFCISDDATRFKLTYGGN